MFQFNFCFSIIFFISLANSVPWPRNENPKIHGPEQVHISYGNTADEMIVVWSTANITKNLTSYVTYGVTSGQLDKMVKGRHAVLTEGNPNGLDQIHKAIMTVTFLVYNFVICINMKLLHNCHNFVCPFFHSFLLFVVCV